MVIALVDLNWARGSSASPGSDAATSAGVAPQRRCHLPVERRRQKGREIVKDIAKFTDELSLGWSCNVRHLGHIHPAWPL